jgi:hypothetical protein
VVVTSGATSFFYVMGMGGPAAIWTPVPTSSKLLQVLAAQLNVLVWPALMAGGVAASAVNTGQSADTTTVAVALVMSASLPPGSLR